jgi:hypothetical protein
MYSVGHIWLFGMAFPGQMPKNLPPPGCDLDLGRASRWERKNRKATVPSNLSELGWEAPIEGISPYVHIAGMCTPLISSSPVSVKTKKLGLRWPKDVTDTKRNSEF